MSTMRTALRRAAAGAGALTLAMAGAMAMGTAASAVVPPNMGPDQPGAPIDGTLTINKYAGAPITGDETLADREKLNGVEFTVSQVGRLSGDPGVCTAINLTDANAWTGLDALFASAPTAPSAPYCLLPGAAKDTVSGQAVFNLGVGVYFVQETADHGNNNIVSKVPNFYVSIPTSSTDGWNYNVVADPKNQLSKGPSKTIESAPSALVVGSTVTWNMTVPVPTLNNNEKFNTAIINDTLDPRLTYVANSTVMTINGAPITDFAISGNLVWTLGAEARAILDANMGKDLLISFNTVVHSVGNGTIVNAANQYSSNFNGTTVPGKTNPVTYWGQLSILKNDNSTPVQALADAQFKVFDAASATGVCPALSAVDSDDLVATGTSGANGVVVWDATTPASSPLGLWIANSNSALTDPSKVYCVYETVVPAGHTAVPFPAAQTITPGVDSVNLLTVVNDKTKGPDLPLTGAQGTLAMTIGGLLLVGVGTGAIVVSRRRSNSAA